MKRLFLLLAALLVATALQAQVMCYEYEYSHTEITKSPLSSKYKYTVEPSYQGKKLYLAIEKRGQSCKAIYSATSDGQYWPQNLLCSDKRTFTYQGQSYDICTDGEMRYTVGIGGSLYNRYYHSKRVFKAYNKATQIYQSAPHTPKFKSDSSRYKNFREWFMLEMPAQDSIRSVQSITIVIEKDGSVTVENVTTGTPQNEQLARQVTEVLARSPKWTPAYDKDGKTPLRFRMKGRDLLLRRTVEGAKRDRELAVSRLNGLCEQWGVDAGHVCCQYRYTHIGGITLEELGERMKTATRPVVVVAVSEDCQPSLNLMQDWNMILKGYEGKYDRYLVLGMRGSNTLSDYSKAFRTSEKNPSILFVYNKYGMSEEREGYSREKGVEFITWFDQMMQKSSF